MDGWPQFVTAKASTTTTGMMERQTPPIFITGTGRSGTSMIAGMLHATGVFVGDHPPPTKHNRKGYFENTEMCEVIDRCFIESGADRIGRDSFPPDDYMPAFALRDAILHARDSAGYIHGLWLLKHTKLAGVWRPLADAFPEAFWVICYRPRRHVLASFVARGYEADTATKMIRFYGGQCTKIRTSRRTKSMQVPTAELIDDPDQWVPHVLRRCRVDFTDLDKLTAAFNFIDPKLWHHRDKSLF